MYKVHQNATLLPFSLECEDYFNDEEKIPALHVSASRNETGTLHISVINLDPENSNELSILFPGEKMNQISAEVITAGQMNALNDFNKEEMVNIQPFRDFKKTRQELVTVLPAKSIVMFKIRE